jgi:DNA repair exonuclease SbcCD ATPase subunit
MCRYPQLPLRPKLDKIAAFSIILITLFAFIFASALAMTLQGTSPREKAETLFLLLKRANSSVTNVFDILQGRNVNLPENALNSYKSATTLAEEASNLYRLNNYMEACNKIIEALQKLKKTLTIVYEKPDNQQSQLEIIQERVALLNSSINRYRDTLRQLENITSSVSGLKTAQAESVIAALKSLLNNASISLEGEDFNAVAVYLNKARNLIEQLTQALNDLAAELKSSRLELYITHTETRLTDIRQNATAVSNTASIAALDEAQTSLAQAKDYLQRQMLNQTVAALIDAKESEAQAIKALTPTTNSNTTNNTSPTTTTRNTTSSINTTPSATVKP